MIDYRSAPQDREDGRGKAKRLLGLLFSVIFAGVALWCVKSWLSTQKDYLSAMLVAGGAAVFCFFVAIGRIR